MVHPLYHDLCSNILTILPFPVLVEIMMKIVGAVFNP